MFLGSPLGGPSGGPLSGAGWGRNRGSGASVRHAFVMLVAMVLLTVSGCVSATDVARHALEDTAQLSAHIDRELAAERVRVSAAILDRADATREEHDAAMAPFDAALEITVDLRDAHLAAQTAIDAAEHGGAKRWEPLITCVFGLGAQLVAIASRRIDLPPEVGEVIQALAGLSEGPCPDPGDAE